MYFEGSLAGKDFRGEDLRGAVFSGVEGHGAIFTNADLRGAIFRGGNFTRASFAGAMMEGVRVESTNFSHANFEAAYMAGVLFVGAKLPFARMYRITAPVLHVEDTEMEHVGLSGAILPRAYLALLNLHGADLSYAILHEVTLRGADLSEADMFAANLTAADLANANLTRVAANHAVFVKANLQEATAHWGSFAQADFTKATLSGADFVRADLEYATLEHTTLWNANFDQANLKWTCLDPAYVEALREFCRACPADERGYRIVYRTKRSPHATPAVEYKTDRPYVAPVFSHSASTTCHPGAYAAPKEWMERNYPHEPLVKCLVRDGEWIFDPKGAIRCWKIEPIEEVTE